MPITEGHTRANGVEFSYLEAGSGPLALCLHGFPDTAHTWRHLLGALADAGFHAVAPFMRGYAPTQIPADGCYQTGALAADANALHDALGGGSDAVLVGHDWGATACYGAAAYAPDRWQKVVTMAVPPFSAMGNAFFSYDQIKRSFYIFFFQSPLAEMAVQMNDLEFIARLWADWSPGYDASQEVENVRRSLGDPANLAAAIGYYRAMFDTSTHREAYADIQAATASAPPQPVLYLHGDRDGCLGVELVSALDQHLPGPGSRAEIVAGTGHFLHLEEPDGVNARIIEFLRAEA